MTGTPIPTELLDALTRSQCVLISSHIRPDGDAIGSLLGMAEIMRSLGKEVVVTLQDQPPYELRRLVPGASILHPSKITGTFDTFISVDASTPDRLGTVLDLAPKPYRFVVIDHHVTNLGFGDVNWVSAEEAATCEMLVRLADAMQVPMTPALAQYLMTGLVTDTLCFRTNSTTPATLEAGMRLLAAGADLADINENILDQRTFPVIRLWGDVLDNATLEEGVLWVTLAMAQFAAAGIDDYEDGSLSSMLIRTSDADISATFIEKKNKQGAPAVECSFRSRNQFDISAVALALGGGGHPQAGGVTINGTLDEVVAQVIPLLKSVRAATLLVASAVQAEGAPVSTEFSARTQA